MKKYFSFFLFILVLSCNQVVSEQIPQIDKSALLTKNLIWDLDSLQKVPNFRYIDSTSRVHEILFEGPKYQGEKTDIFAYYSNPDIIKTGKNQGNKFPGVVLISGGSQPALKEWVERWAQEGYAAITCDYGNTSLVKGRGPLLKNLEDELAFIYDSIAHGPKSVRAYRTSSIVMLAHSLLLSFPEVEKNKTVVTGISWGGFQTCIVAGIDNRFKAAVPVYGCAFHDEIIFKKNFTNLTKEQVEMWMEQIDPKNYIGYSHCPILFITGDNDGCFDIEPFDKTTKLVSKENRFVRITPNMGHDHLIGWKPQEIAVFFNSILKDGVPLPRVTEVIKKDTIIEFNYISSLNIKDAYFYYSNDTLHINSERTWKSVKANINDNKIICQYPKEGFIYGYLYITDVKDLSTSSELIINKTSKK